MAILFPLFTQSPQTWESKSRQSTCFYTICFQHFLLWSTMCRCWHSTDSSNDHE